MEASESVFEQGLDGPENDPFGAADEEFAAEITEEPVADVPLVDAEGNPVEPDPIPASSTAATAVAGASASPSSVAAPSEPAAPSEAPVNPDMGKTLGEVEAERELERVSASDVQAAEVGLGMAEAEAAPPAEPDPIPAKTAKAPAGLRRYCLFTPEGSGKFAEVAWHEDKKGKMVAKGTEGAKRVTVAVARGQEDALAIGYAAMGSPPDGVKLVAVAETYWQVKHVAPDPTPPIRVPLKIS